MVRRLAIVIVLALLVAGGAQGYGGSERQAELNGKIARLQDRIAAANQREAVLTSEISSVTAKIRSLQGDVDDASTRVAVLERELALYERRLDALTELRRVQTERLELLRRQNAIADRRLSERLIAIYQSEDAGTLEVVLASSNFTELLDQLAYRKEIGEQDRRIVRQVAASRTNVRIARARTERTRGRVARATKAIAVRTEARRAERDRLLAGQAALASARSDKERTLASVQEGKEVYLNEVAGLQRQSAALGASIRAAQA
ncbi:MAG: hypothetical protein H0V40_12095, partial [Actinobacteria bacterium]|nr:hypothetical protein [Actinomycetota bacterium]